MQATATTTTLQLNGAMLCADVSGALWWPARAVLAVADLHFEKGSAMAQRGALLPPFDTAATLLRLEELMHRYRPRTVVCVGDSFHDPQASARIAAAQAERLAALTARCDWIWVVGNHDPAPPLAWGGCVALESVQGPLRFRHEADPRNAGGEVSGHFHPKARVRVRVGGRTGRCFVSDGRRLILPAFGAYAGGLDVLDPAIDRLFPAGFVAHVIGKRRLVAVPRAALTTIG